MAPRSMWKGSVGFGMVIIPCKMYSAVGDPESPTKDIHQMHSVCGTRIKMPKYCPTCAKQVEAAEIIKGYQADKEKFIPITPNDLAGLPLASAQAINIVGFLAESNLDKLLDDPRWFQDCYYLAPEDMGNAQRAFGLFMEAMDAMSVMGIAKIAIRDREHLCAVRPFNGVMMLQTLHWASELKPWSELSVSVTVTSQEMELAQKLIGSMIKPVELSSFRDEYGDALKRLIEAKLSGSVLPITAAAPKPSAASLVDALLASLGGPAEPAKP